MSELNLVSSMEYGLPVISCQQLRISIKRTIKPRTKYTYILFDIVYHTKRLISDKDLTKILNHIWTVLNNRELYPEYCLDRLCLSVAKHVSAHNHTANLRN